MDGQLLRAQAFSKRFLDDTYWDTPQLVELLWTSDRLFAETATWQQTTSEKTEIHASGGIRTLNYSKRTAADLLYPYSVELRV